MNVSQIAQYLNIGLIVLFVLIVLGFLIACFRGFMRGVWKSTHNMIFMLTLILIAFFTLDALTDFIGQFPLSNIIGGSFYLSRTIDGEVVTYYVPITNVKDTLTEFIQGFYTLYNVSASASSAANFALALSTSVLKIIIFIVDMLLIITIGNLFSLLSWYIIFQHFVPKIAQKAARFRWIGLIETAVTFLVVTFLFFTPFTSMVNSFNQSYQNSSKQANSQIAKDVGQLVDTYNNSIFAKVFFNWTVDNNGMTIDTRLFDKLTTGKSGEYTIGVVGELANITNVIANVSSAVSQEAGKITVDTASLVTQEIVDKAFDTIINSGVITSILPVVTEIALNSDLLAEFVPDRLVDLSDVVWEEELGYVRDMVDCVFLSGVVDELFVTNEEGQRDLRSMQGEDLYNFINTVVYSENFDSLLDIFKKIDDSKVLSRAISAILNYAINNDKSGTVKQYLPLSWEELNELSWGYESYVLLDFFHATAELDPDFVKAIFIQTGVIPSDPDVKSLPTLIAEHAQGFRQLVVGKFNNSGELVNVNKRGQSIVLDSNGNRIKDGDVARHYCLFDMHLMDKIYPNLLDNLFDLEGLSTLRANISDEDLIPYHEAIAELNQGERLKNYKKEFNVVFDVIATVAQDQELLDALFTGKGLTPLMVEENNFFSIDSSHIDYLKTAISKMDDSTLLYNAIAPILKSTLLLEDVTKTFDNVGLKANVIADAIEKDIKKDKNNHQLFDEFSSLLDRWPDLKNIYSLAGLSDTNEMMDKLKDREVINSLVNILDELHDNTIVNPQYDGVDFEKNENLYSMLEFIFEMTHDLGLEIDRNLMKQVEDYHTWNEEFTALGEVLYFVANHDLMNASTAFDDGLTRTSIDKLRGTGDEDYNIPGLFTKINDSTLFAKSFGPFLDNIFGDALQGFLIDQDKGITFSNVNDWKVEGNNINNLLDSLYNITPVDDEEARNFLTNFDISKFDNIIDLNAMLHDLAHSGIFTHVDEQGEHYEFNKWLYSKLESTLGDFEVDGAHYDLLKDPEFDASSNDEWKVSWGTRPDELGNGEPEFVEWKNEYYQDGDNTHYLTYRDFVHDYSDDLGGDIKTFWCDYETFNNKQAAFMEAHEVELNTTYASNDWGAYFASEKFINDYEEVFAVDEISRVSKFLCYSLMLIKPKTDNSTLSFDSMPSSLLKGLLESINDTHCMRMSIYNVYRIASETVSSSFSALSFSSAYISYMIDADQASIYDFENARPLRSEEFDKLLPLYDFIEYANDNDLIESGDFKYDMINDYDTKPNGFMRHFENALLAMNKSLVFHLKGSAKKDKMTVFQETFDYLLGENGTKDTLYLGDNSPKDKIATAYDSKDSKTEYLLTTVFDIENTEAANALREEEIHYFVYSFNLMYSLTDNTGEPVTSIENADLSYGTYGDANREIIYDLLRNLNDSDLLRDLVPNTVYNLFIGDPIFSITGGSEPVDFTRVDPFYHYFYDPSTLTKRVDYDAKYSNADISGLNSILADYQNFDQIAGSANWNNKATLLNIIGTDGGNFVGNGALPMLLKDMHACHLFHTPARNYGSGYYTDKFNNGYTLFENTMSIVCSSIGLDTFAYDATYDLPKGFNNANEKLFHNIKEVTAADDGLTTDLVYHHNANEAWDDEVDALMRLAFDAANSATGDKINAESFKMESLAPAQVKLLLTGINNSNLVCDALPNFIRDGFKNIGLGGLTSYKSVNYANYHLNQVAYGGDEGLSGEGSEIDNIYQVLDALRDGSSYISGFNDINAFVASDSTGSRLNGLIRFVYESRILNTPVGQNYGTYNTSTGYRISAQGVLLFNIFNDSSLSGFIACDALTTTIESNDYQKIQQLSIIIHMPYDDADAISAGLTYEIESTGLRRLIQIIDTYNITANTFSDAGNYDIKYVRDNYETPLLNIINIAYDADEHGHRSALASEFVGGLLNNILENEYNGLDEKAILGYVYNQFSFGKPDTYTYVKYTHYDSINVVEKNGIQGILDCLQYVDQLNDPFALKMMSADDRKAIADGIESCFALATTDVDGNLSNSKFARIIYLNDVHQIFKLFAPIPNANNETFADYLVNETSTSTTAGSRTVYSVDFTFANYGTAFKNYVYPGFF